MHVSTNEQNKDAAANAPNAPATALNADGVETGTQNSTGSTLIEFPGTGRSARPLWRKELSERVREIQQRRAREASLETGDGAPPRYSNDTPSGQSDAAGDATNNKDVAAKAKQLGLVPPPPDAPELNPIVAAALRRIERAHKSAPHMHRPGSGRTNAATAVARAAEENYEPEVETPAAPELATAISPEGQNASVEEVERTRAKEKLLKTTEAARASSLVVVPSKQAAKEDLAASAAASKTTPAVTAKETAVANASLAVTTEQESETSVTASSPETEATSGKPQPRRIAGVIDDSWLERNGVEVLPKVASATEAFDDRASLTTRVAASAVDLLVVGFLSAPFAAVIELSIGNWGDPRVSGSMAGIVGVVMFLYLTCSTALAGRTWGMSLFSMHTVDARTALAPTTGQCVRRALIFMLSLAAFGLGILYAIFDAEGRTAHDHLSGTVIVKG